MIESERLHYIHKQCETFENLHTVQEQGATNFSNVGQCVILPSSFTSVVWISNFFITVTCNPKWPEIKRFLKDTMKDKPDILCRLFKMKLDALIKELKDNALFGKVQAVVYTMKFQKHGLPHTEIPDKDEDPDLYYL
ncbi:hypothetical protein OSB04_016744 [Centaurea solstitialis]|uniref:Helitron helicase-like domain-containing protein n=1 Tax=Centaurea solstitialis TaxID=347529 RepID=A0AA38T374_9ASTR|nr:hypothetical protein OSB04_016744 [Centaurea solstitialis]